MPTALLLTEDLFVASQVSVSLATLATVTQVACSDGLAGLIAQQNVGLLLIDLSSRPAPAGLKLLPTLREKSPGLRVVAFGPHVQLGKLDDAQQAGCDLVLTRGQMLRNGVGLLGGLLGGDVE